MKNHLIKFSYPYKSAVLIISAVMIFSPMIILNIIGFKNVTEINPILGRLIFLIPSLFVALGFIYCTLGYHFQILKVDELKLRIHLEALNIAFTTALVFLNFYPTMLNYLIIILAVVAIVAYVIGIEFVKEKYR